VVLSSETDQIADRIGFRTIETRGTNILLNASFVRLALYPHARVANELGLMVWQRIPVYSTIQWVLGLWPAVVVAYRA
jgi:beta-glucuronidase